jgi:hypothetical protein
VTVLALAQTYVGQADFSQKVYTYTMAAHVAIVIAIMIAMMMIAWEQL